MKKSLLLIGLATFAGLAASAQAATVAHRPHTQSAGAGLFAAALGLDGSLLSTLNDLLSGNTQAANAHARTCGCGNDTQTAERTPKRLRPPGPTTTMPMTADPLIRAGAAADNPPPAPPPAAASGGTPPAAETEADLGWQSLLPGSIQ